MSNNNAPDVRSRLAAIRARRAACGADKRWQWERGYELASDQDIDKHWALFDPDHRHDGGGDACVDYSLVTYTTEPTDLDDVPLNETGNFRFIEHAPEDIDTLLGIIDALLAERTAPTAAGAAEPITGEPDLQMEWWHLPEFGAFMALDTEGQRDNSYGPFDTREEAQADWLKIISSPPPGESEGAAVNDDERTIDDIRRELAEAWRMLDEYRSIIGELEDELWELEHPDNAQPEPEAKP